MIQSCIGRAARLFIAITLLAVCAPIAQGQATDPATDPVTGQQVSEAIAAVEAAADMDEASKARALELLRTASEQVQTRNEWIAREQELEAARLDAPERINEIEAGLLLPAKAPDPDNYDDLSATELTELLAVQERELVTLRNELTELEREPARRAERRRQIPDLQKTARQRLEEVGATNNGATATGERAEIATARRLANRARTQAINAELRAYEAELRSYDARGRLITLRIDQATRRVTVAEALSKLLRDLLAERQAAEAREAFSRARERILEASNAPPEIRTIVKNLADENAKIIRQHTGSEGIAQNIRVLSKDLEDLDNLIATLTSDMEVLRAKLDASGRGEAVGLLMQNQLAELPDTAAREREIRRRETQIASIQLELIEYTQRRRELSDIEVLVDQTMARLPASIPEGEREVMEDVLRQAYWANRKAIDAIITDYEAAFDRLVDINAKESELIRITREFRLFISENILWIRSGTPINRETLRDTVSAVQTFGSPRSIARIPSALFSDARSFPIAYLLGVGLIGALVGFRRELRKRVVSTCAESSRSTSTDQMSILWTTAYTLLYGAAYPVGVLFLAWRIAGSYDVDSVGAAIGSGLQVAAIVWLCIQLARAFLLEKGVCDVQLRWNDAAVTSLRRHLFVYGWIWVPTVLIIATCEAYGETAYKESLGRFAFLIMLATTLVALITLLRSESGPVATIAHAYREKNLYSRLHRPIYSLGVIVVIALGAAAGIGYYYSALQLFTRFAWTALLIFGCWILLGIAIRWSLIEKRKLIVEQWRKHRKSGDSGVIEHQVDIVKVDSQITNLLRFLFLVTILGALAFVWTDMFPALGVLDGVELWNTTEVVTTESTDAEGARVISTDEVIRAVTLRHAIIAIFIAVVAVVSVRNLPGMLEVGVLQRTGLSAGERYAISAITGYAVALVGMIFVFNALGLVWSQLQWLVAALGLGLGFGLQEIFANFVSGLIILFERPVRVGDTVTVGDISGKVSRIKIRATWIAGFNRRELVVPNKELVTGRLINWTLSDEILRIEIPVGIAYGSDVRLAKKLLMQAAEDCELLATEPKPEVYFFEFGDSALQLELRVFSPSIEKFLAIKDDLHLRIDDLFRENGIEISFPQRDLHLRSVPEAWKVSAADPSVDNVVDEDEEETSD